MTTATPILDADIEAHAKLSRDLKKAARDLPRRSARYMVDTFYQVQKFRIRTNNQIFAAEKLAESSELLVWQKERFHHLEKQMESCLGQFSNAYRVGRWMRSICGIGPIISAGLLCHIDIRKAPTCGHVWRFAGLDPSLDWLGREGAKNLVSAEANGQMTEDAFRTICRKANRHPENVRRLIDADTLTKTNVTDALAKRPYNVFLKTLCAEKLTSCFIKAQHQKSDFYGALYREYKERITAANEAGDYEEAAKEALRTKNYSKSTDAYQAYSEGRLPKGHLDRRAKRWVAKLFLSHLHQVMYEDYHQKPAPRPYAFDRLPNHTHFVDPPNWPQDFPGRRLTELLD